MSTHQDHANLIWQIAGLLRGPYRPPQYERVMLPMTVLRRFDCVLAPTKDKVLAEQQLASSKVTLSTPASTKPLAASAFTITLRSTSPS